MNTGNIVRAVVVGASVIAAAGSASAPGKHTVQASTDIQHGYDATWSAVIDAFSDHNWAILNMEKDSGLITTDWMGLSGDDMRYVDCGSEGIASIKSTQVRFNVRVKGDESTSSVTVNTKFRQERTSDGSTWMTDCVSTGVVERNIQSEVDTRAASVRPRKAKPAVAAKPAVRGFYCSASATAGFCDREKTDCAKTRDAALGAVPDLSDCILTEKAWCMGDTCMPTHDACTARADKAGSGAACEERE